MLLHVLTTPATQPMRQELRARSANLNRRALTTQRQSKQSTKKSTDETDRQNRLPTHPQAANHHTIRLRNAAARCHRLFCDHPRNKGGRRYGCDEPRRQQPRSFTDLRVYPSGRGSGLFDAETIENHQQARNKANKNASTRHFPLQLVEAWDQRVDRGRLRHLVLLSAYLACPILENRTAIALLLRSGRPILENRTNLDSTRTTTKMPAGAKPTGTHLMGSNIIWHHPSDHQSVEQRVDLDNVVTLRTRTNHRNTATRQLFKTLHIILAGLRQIIEIMNLRNIL